jgi:hypothetical protein
MGKSEKKTKSKKFFFSYHVDPCHKIALLKRSYEKNFHDTKFGKRKKTKSKIAAIAA